MSFDRRKFIKFSGLTVLGLAGRTVGDTLSKTDTTEVAETGSLQQPLTAHRWAMVVDMKKCRQQEGCRDCITACHREHNVPHFDNPKDEIKWIWKSSFKHAFHEQEHEYLPDDLKNSHVLLLCNHCDNPPCTKVCPTQATWKRESDGVVMMDWHRCIGCRYCMVACPYGSRSFNWRDPRSFIEEIKPEYPTRTRGVVEKCTFCDERLARGLPPACVEACKEKALVFGDLEDPESEVRQLLQGQMALQRKPALGTIPEVYYLV
ncbi:MAG: sulfate reduction electron transfer complex DsrMKJOP subunit DsrO [bacterium]